MIPRLDRLSRDLPDMKLHLAAQDDTPAAPLSGLDAALLLAAPPWPAGWRVDALAPERIGPVFSPRYAGAKRLIGRPARTLVGEALLRTESRPQAWPDWARAMRIKTGAFGKMQSFPHLYYLLEAAVAGLGVAIAPAPLVADELASGRLVAPWGFVPTAGFWLLATPQRQRAAVGAKANAERLAAWLQNELSGE
jgi:DNA-binding transcriptional LysR family regulator